MPSFYFLLTFASLGFLPFSQPSLRTRALEIAARGMRQNIVSIEDSAGVKSKLILAGAHQFHAFWVRDFCEAVPGYLRLGEFEAVRDSLDAIFKVERISDGVIPRGLDHIGTMQRILWQYLGISMPFKAPLYPSFETENNVLSIDGNLLVPVAAWKYLKAHPDPERESKWWPLANLAMSWIEKNHLGGDLVDRQPPYSDWADSLGRAGRVALSNEKYLLALQAMSEWAKAMNKKAEAQAYFQKFERSKKAFLQFFYDKNRNLFRNYESDEHLSADANFLALAEGLVSKAEAKTIIENLKSSALWKGRTSATDYPLFLKSKFVRGIGLQDYHDGLFWIWLGATAAMASKYANDSAACDSILDEISFLIVKDNQVFEIYENCEGQMNCVDFKPVNRLLYKSERPFTWSSAKFFEAVNLGCQ